MRAYMVSHTDTGTGTHSTHAPVLVEQESSHAPYPSPLTLIRSLLCTRDNSELWRPVKSKCYLSTSKQLLVVT